MPIAFTADDFKSAETFTADDFKPVSPEQDQAQQAASMPAEAEALKAAEHTADLAAAAKATPIEANSEALANHLGWAEWMVHGVAHPIQQTETAIEQTAIAAGLAKPGSKLLVSPSKALETPAFGEIPHLPPVETSLAHPIASTGRQIGRGVINATIDFANFFTTPEGAALLGTGQLPAASQKVVARTFAVQLATQAPQQLANSIEQAQAGNIQQAAQEATAGLGGVFMARTIENHLNAPVLRETPKTLPDKVAEAGAPATAQALKETAPAEPLETALEYVGGEMPRTSAVGFEPPPITESTLTRLEQEANQPETVKPVEAAPAVETARPAPPAQTPPAPTKPVGEMGKAAQGSELATPTDEARPPQPSQPPQENTLTDSMGNKRFWAKTRAEIVNLEPIKESELTKHGTYPSAITKFGYERGDKKVYAYEGKYKATEAPKPEPPKAGAEGEIGPTVQSNEPRSPSALGVSPIPFAQAMTGKLSDMVPAIRGTLKTMAGETMPKTTLVNREAGEAGAHYGQSPFFAHYAARALSESVLPYESPEPFFTGGLPFAGSEYLAHLKPDTKKPPINPAKFGAALTEDALRGRRQEFLKKAAAATTPEEAAKFTEMANNVGTLIGKFGIFRDEAALQAFAKDPDVLAAVDRLKQLYAAELDPLAKQAGLDITTKPESGGLFPGAFINLFVPKEGGLPSRTTVKTRPTVLPAAGAPGPSAGTPNLTATMKKRSRFGLQRTGAAEAYGVDFHDMVANAFGGFTEIARKNEFDQALVKAGLAKIQQEYPGPGWKYFPYEKKQILGLDEGDVAWRKSVSKGVWVKNSIAGEYTRVSNVYRNEFSPTATRFLLNAVNKFQMLGVLDATFHSTALLRRLWEAPLGKTDTALSLLRPLTLPKRLSMLAENIFQERLAKNDKLAELANIGALTGHGQLKPHQIIRRTVNFLEENVRLTLSDMYDHLVKEGAPDTETARREYINGGLQYNRRFQGPIMQVLRNLGVGPFATAGRAGLARGIRRWFLQDWIPGQDAAGQAWTAANVLTKMAGTALLVGVINRAVTGSWMPPGIPLGNVATGKTDEKTGKPITIPLANLMGSEMRGARALGLKAIAEGKREGLTVPQIADSMYKDSFNAISHPGIGPAVQALYGLTYGRPTAIGAPDYPKVAPGSGQSQVGSNAKQALEELNPMIVRGGENLASWATGGKIAPAEEAPLERVKGVAVQLGQKPMTAEERQNMINFSQLKKYTDQLATEARKIKLEKRAEFVLERFDKDKLGEDYRRKAIEQLKRHGVFTHE